MTIRVKIENADENNRPIRVKTRPPGDLTGPGGSPDRVLKSKESADFWVHSAQALLIEEVDDG